VPQGAALQLSCGGLLAGRHDWPVASRGLLDAVGGNNLLLLGTYGCQVSCLLFGQLICVHHPRHLMVMM
jgi:hypothetical protein